VEKKFTEHLPVVSEEFQTTDTTIVVADSKLGWASSFKELIGLLYSGRIPSWDVSKVRKKGERLKTFGGRASGSEPLVDLFNFTVRIFQGAAGRKLTPLECHDLMCKVGDIVVVGGVRRSAMISLSDLEDSQMRTAKFGSWWDANPHRALSNNSVCYETKPTMEQFIDEWKALYMSHSGERGIFSRAAAKMLAPERRDTNHDFGTNPCSEIVLRPNQFCNLTEVIVRPEDTLDELKEKVRIATIIGTFQSTLTNFRYLRSIWQKNTEEERLLGVSLTGICDHPILNGGASVVYTDLTTDGQTRMPKLRLEKWLREMKEVAIETNKTWADRLGIPVSTSITCVKPSGTVSQLCDSSSGIHPRYNDYYIRRVRQDNKDPLTQFLKDNGIPSEPCYMKPDTTTVFAFPMKAPKGAITRQDKTAIEQLEHWLVYQKHWCEHKPSITVYVREDEWLETGAWVYKNFDYMSGVSFLPFDNGSYQQAPYTDIDKEGYEKALSLMPESIEWSDLVEEEDNTTSSQELACTGNSCEL
jgi:ribonucleoside-diphosphate reductase alpha chain